MTDKPIFYVKGQSRMTYLVGSTVFLLIIILWYFLFYSNFYRHDWPFYHSGNIHLILMGTFAGLLLLLVLTKFIVYVESGLAVSGHDITWFSHSLVKWSKWRYANREIVRLHIIFSVSILAGSNVLALTRFFIVLSNGKEVQIPDECLGENKPATILEIKNRTGKEVLLDVEHRGGRSKYSDFQIDRLRKIADETREIVV